MIFFLGLTGDDNFGSIATEISGVFAPDALTQRKRIVHVTYEAVYDGVDNTYDHATHYDYDIHGNVKTLLQDNRSIAGVSNISKHRFKRTDYIYDLISGNVHRVDYQTGQSDQWHHTYEYDADNRITEVYTSTETPITSTSSTVASLQNEPVINPLWDQEAEYSYYAHGPLARTELGEEKVQGLDYVYTLQGWIKGVNSNTLDPNRDPGLDGLALSATHNVARDVFGYSLHYFNNDYVGAIGGNNSFLADQTSSDLTANSADLYNGNIARMVTTIADPNTRAVLPLGNAYKYDQLNRLKEARSFNNIDLSGNIWHSGGTEMYYNAFTYDANGNIQTQYRADENNLSIDELTYNYETGYNSAPRNRLSYVSDVSNNTFANELIDQQSGNYQYDKEGRLIHDEKEEIRKIIWRVDGKVKKIERLPNSTKKNVSFDYDAMGHRIAKHVYTSANVWEKSTYYVLDAQGNTLTTYEYANDDVNHILTYAQTEKHIYGSSRLGVNAEVVPLYGSQNATYSMKLVQHKIGQRTYELSNHLGNVLSIISDKVIPHQNGSTVDYWLADIRHSQDYSPFGVKLHNRNLSLSTTGNKPYSYGFQNQLEDAETGLVNFKFRMHDPRLGRFFAIDPLSKEYPHNSPYAFSENRVIDCIELEGLELWDAVVYKDADGTVLKTIYSLHQGPDVSGMGHEVGIYYQVFQGSKLVQEVKENNFSTFHAPNTNLSMFNRAMYEKNYTVKSGGTYSAIKGKGLVTVNTGDAISMEMAIKFQIPVVGKTNVVSHTETWKPIRLDWYFDNDIADKFSQGEGKDYSGKTINLGIVNEENLEEVAQILIQNAGQTVQVQGHTSTPETSRKGGNQQLSEDRAKYVRDRLVERCKQLDPNFDESRVTFMGFGSTRPVVSNDNGDNMTDEQKEAAQAKNRRTVVVIKQNGVPGN